MEEGKISPEETPSLAITPTWLVATVLTIFVVISLVVERSIQRLSRWLEETKRKPLLAAIKKMKEELMLLGFISLLLTAASSIITIICIPTKLYESPFTHCRNEDTKNSSSHEEFQLLCLSASSHLPRRCPPNHEPFVSFKGLEQLHRFIFLMAITHISYSCLTMLLAIVKIQSWREWEAHAHSNLDRLSESTRQKTLRRQKAFDRHDSYIPLLKNKFHIWVTCFFRQFGSAVVRTDYLTLREGFILNHKLPPGFDFHNYMVLSMEEEFSTIVGVSGPLWGFVVALMLLNINGSNLFFWIAIIPIALVLLVGAKLQNIVATLSLESVVISGYASGAMLKPRDDLFWFKKPELLLKLIHFILFQNAFELATFFWFWWQFGYRSCYMKNHFLVYIRQVLGFAGQFLCSYSTLPLYALTTQMGTNYKPHLRPQRIRETEEASLSRRRHKSDNTHPDDSTKHTDSSAATSLEEDECHMLDIPEVHEDAITEIEVQPAPAPLADEASSRVGTPLLRPSASISPAKSKLHATKGFSRSTSTPARSDRVV